MLKLIGQISTEEIQRESHSVIRFLINFTREWNTNELIWTVIRELNVKYKRVLCTRRAHTLEYQSHFKCAWKFIDFLRGDVQHVQWIKARATHVVNSSFWILS